MKREGRQHGTVRTICISPTNPLNPSGPVLKKSSPTLASPPTAGIFTRVTTKPTNHSKFTGKCGRPRCSDCHLHPSWKSKDKIKGVRTKLRSKSGLEVGYGGLLEWRVMPKVDDESWAYDRWILESQSASDMLYDLQNYDGFDNHDFEYFGKGGSPYIFHRYPRYGNRNRNRNRNRPLTVEEVKLDLDSLIEYPFIESAIRPVSNEIEEADVREGEGQDGVVEEEDEDGIMGKLFDEIFVVEDEDMGFYDVGIVWDPIDGDEGWSLIGAI